MRADLAPLEARATFFHHLDEVGGARRRPARLRGIELQLAPLSSPVQLTALLLLLRRRQLDRFLRGLFDGIAYGPHGERLGHRETDRSQHEVRFSNSPTLLVHTASAV